MRRTEESVNLKGPGAAHGWKGQPGSFIHQEKVPDDFL